MATPTDTSCCCSAGFLFFFLPLAGVVVLPAVLEVVLPAVLEVVLGVVLSGSFSSTIILLVFFFSLW